MRQLLVLAVALVLGGARPLGAQDAGRDRQIEEAVLAAPEAMRAQATVLGYGGEPREDDPLTTLREGSGSLVCLADDPAADGFHVACYHRSLEPYMALGRRLRAAGRDRAQVMEARLAAVEAGTLSMPSRAVLYSITAAEGSFDRSTATVADARRLVVVYVPYATAEELGLPIRPEGNTPWLMLPGTAWAHIMIAR